MCEQLQMRYVLVFVVVGTLLGITSPAMAVEVTFPDANLEAAVRDARGIPTRPITDTDMESMGTFNASSRGISNIQGLEYATNLTYLRLDTNMIGDISALSGLTNLDYLNLHQNQISDISAVSALTSLDILNLTVNQISDISAVSGLTNLTGLYLSENPISDISVVAGLTKLNWLHLTTIQISDISAVSGLTNLTGLYLSENQISDISVIAGLTNLNYLNLSDNQISDISVIAGLTNLNYLNLSNNHISDTSVIAGLTNLTRLLLVNNQIETMNLSNSNLSSLTDLHLADNPLTSVLLENTTLSQTAFDALMDGGIYTGIAELSGVLNLDMSGVDFTAISDLSVMYTADDLETLHLAGATNLNGSQVVSLTVELASLDQLDVTALWDSFDAGTQSSLNAWDAIPGNTLVVPEPNSFTLLGIGIIFLTSARRRRCNR